jgi:hypothetical protein
MLTERFVRKVIPVTSAFLSASIFAACGERTTGPLDEDGPGDIDLPESASLVGSFGDGQTGRVGEPLARTLGVAILGDNGEPVEGIPVEFAIVEGNGSLSNASTTTNEDGTAKTIWILGVNSGTGQTMRATIGEIDSDPVLFRANALPGPAKLLALVDGDRQDGVAGQTLPRIISVRVTDEYGNGVPIQLVKFSTNTGHGAMTPGNMDAGPNGSAQANWTLGDFAGGQEASIWSPGLTGSPIRLTATAQ